MTVKQAIDCAIASGMTTFEIKHNNYRGKRHEQTIDTIYDFIKGYENDVVMSIHFGNAYTQYNAQTKTTIYTRPHHCFITFRGASEQLPVA